MAMLHHIEWQSSKSSVSGVVLGMEGFKGQWRLARAHWPGGWAGCCRRWVGGVLSPPVSLCLAGLAPDWATDRAVFFSDGGPAHHSLQLLRLQPAV